MKTRSFIGLLLLVIALVVVASPSVLEPAAGGLDRAATTLGIPAAKTPKDPSVPTAPTDGSNFDPKAKDVEVAPRAMIVKGYDEGDPDLRDRFQAADRDPAGRGRLVAGQSRLPLPGQEGGSDLLLPPTTAEGGVLLDVTGCPVFAPGADVAAMMADPDTIVRYEERVANADDAALCGPLFDQRVEAAINPTASPAGDMTTRAAQRDVAASIRTGGLAVVSLTAYVDALEAFSGPTPYGDAVYAALAAADATAAGKDAATTATSRGGG